MAVSGSLQRGLAILVALGQYHGGVGSSQLARDVEMPVSSVHRVLKTLIDSGFVNYNSQTRSYELGIKVFELSHRVPIVRSLLELSVNPLRRLANDTGETSLLAIRDMHEMVYINQTPGWQSIQVYGTVGERGPLHCTSMGKVLLAFLPEEERDFILKDLELVAYTPHTITDPQRLRQELAQARERGYAIANEEHELQVRAIGVPVLNRNHELIAALPLAGPVFRVKINDLEQYLPLLREAAHEIGIKVS
jgi:DNA-binding IclR family transcriptional regulator